MPPEYASSGHFSTKSDVFSYGVIVLEIVFGKKNREFSDPKCNNNLLGYASIMNVRAKCTLEYMYIEIEQGRS